MGDSIGGYSTKSDLAYVLVRDRILSQELLPGAPLNQAVLARELGISTTPLREALRRLESESLVELDAHRDARVTGLSTEEARDLLELRRALDPLAASLAAERRGPNDIAETRTALEELWPLRNRPGTAELTAHRRFHRAVYVASHNGLLVATLDGLWDKADRYRLVGVHETQTQAERDATATEHRDLLNAVLSRDSTGAADIMLQHISSSQGLRAVLRLSADGPEPRTPGDPHAQDRGNG